MRIQSIIIFGLWAAAQVLAVPIRQSQDHKHALVEHRNPSPVSPAGFSPEYVDIQERAKDYALEYTKQLVDHQAQVKAYKEAKKRGDTSVAKPTKFTSSEHTTNGHKEEAVKRLHAANEFKNSVAHLPQRHDTFLAHGGKPKDTYTGLDARKGIFNSHWTGAAKPFRNFKFDKDHPTQPNQHPVPNLSKISAHGVATEHPITHGGAGFHSGKLNEARVLVTERKNGQDAGGHTHIFAGVVSHNPKTSPDSKHYNDHFLTKQRHPPAAIWDSHIDKAASKLSKTKKH